MPRPKQAQSSAATFLIVIVGSSLLLIFAKVLLVPLSFALTLSFLLVPAVSWLERKGASRNVAVLTAGGLTCLVLLIGAMVLSKQILSVAETLPNYRANIQKRIDSLRSSSEGSLEAALSMLEDLSGTLTNRVAEPTNATPVRLVAPPSAQLRATEKLATEILSPIGEIGIVLIFTIYMLVNREELRHRLLLLAGMTHINLMTRALEDATARISQYLVMQFQVNACYGILFGTGLYFLGVPEATLWGVIAGTIRIVPFAGTLIGMLLPLTLSIAVSTNWAHPLGVLALFLVLETTLVNVIEPWLFSERTGISSLALLASAIFWSMLWGWPGLVLSTPLTVCVVVLGRYVPQLSFLHSLLGTNARLSPAAHMYERLLATDQDEAFAIAENYLQTGTLVSLYDSVIIPVLSLAEQDRHTGALDAIQSKFVLLSMTEMIARLSEHRDVASNADNTSERSIKIDALRKPLQKEFAAVCLSAGGRATDLTTLMLTQLLERAGHQTLMMTADTISDDILKALAAEKDTVVFISALPPFAFAQTRSIYQRARDYLPGNRIAVALWHTEEDSEELSDRFGPNRPDLIVATLAQAIGQVKSWQQATRKA